MARVVSALKRATCLALCATALGLLPLQQLAAEIEQDPFTIDTYFDVQRVVELAVSSDGNTLAFVVEAPSLSDDRLVRRVLILPLNSNSSPTEARELADARQLAWIADTQDLAFISDRSGSAQVFAYDFSRKRIRQITHAADPVTKFAAAPAWSHLAYSTELVDSAPSLADRLRQERTGQVIDIDLTSVFDFLDPTAGGSPLTASETLWFMAKGGTAENLRIAGEPADFHWSPDGAFLSVVYVAKDLPQSLLRSYRTSIGIFNTISKSFHVVAEARAPIPGHPGKIFSGGEWLPVQRQIFLKVTEETDPWVSRSYPSWTTVDPALPGDAEALSLKGQGETYDARFFPRDDSTILVENTVRGTRSLFEWSDKGMRPSSLVNGIAGSSSLFSFSHDMRTVAFANESLTRAPEVLVKRSTDAHARRVTNLNARIEAKALPQAAEVIWQSSDGTRASGWLISPDVGKFKKPWPLITYVHGGPGYVFPDKFTPNFAEPFWPYPFEVYALKGIAVFIPNYRGTASFGRRFHSPSGIDREPVDDITTGIHELTGRGIADAKRLGISGHSHGAWLGPLVMARSKMFVASSFAEGTPNMMVNYDLMSALLNRDVHDVIIGSPYEVPDRYISISPGLQMRGLQSANLFEGGAFSEAIFMLGYAKPSHRFAGPTQFVVYPNTGHTLTAPRLQREAAERNLNWFRFWLLGEGANQAPSAELNR